MAGPTKQELQQQLEELENDYSELTRGYYNMANKLYEAERKNEEDKRKRNFAGSVCFDFWPPSDWLRLRVGSWKPGKYFQIYLGPFRFDFYED